MLYFFILFGFRSSFAANILHPGMALGTYLVRTGKTARDALDFDRCDGEECGIAEAPILLLVGMGSNGWVIVAIVAMDAIKYTYG